MAQGMLQPYFLREKRLPFGISACYTSQNLDSISSEAFIDQLTAWGAKFIWYFHYMPVGNDAAPALLPSPEQRTAMYRRVFLTRSISSAKASSIRVALVKARNWQSECFSHRAMRSFFRTKGSPPV